MRALVARSVVPGTSYEGVIKGESPGRTASFSHPIEDTLYAEKGGRGFVLVSDGAEAVTGTIFADGTVEGAWSRSRGFITLAEDYVKHDIYIMKIVQRYDRELTARFGPKYERLRDVFSDTEVTI